MLHTSNLAEARANQELARQSAEFAKQSADLAQQSRDLGQYTALLARQASADSASMITIAAVTMFFLPATFVSVSLSLVFRLHWLTRYSHCSAWASLSSMMLVGLLLLKRFGFILL
jgi:hypothetical protein